MKNLILSAAALAMSATVSAADVSVISNTNIENVEEINTDVDCSCIFTNFYFGLGLGLKSAQLKSDDGLGWSHKYTNTNAIGTLILGGGKSFRNWYFGSEILCDFSKNKKGDYNYKGIQGRLQNGGTVPSFMLRGGYIIPSQSLLVYLKAGISILRDKNGATGYSDTKLNKVAPAIALGIEKPFCNKFSIRSELEYSFKADKKSNDGSKFRNKGIFNWRVLFTYNVRI